MEAIREAIRIERLSKTFGNGRKALDEIDLRVAPGEMVALIGASGSGKSTLLRHIAGFTASDAQPSQIEILGRPIQQNGRIVREVRSIRRDIGFVFQQFNLVNRLSVETNVLIGALARLPWWRRLSGRFPRAERALSLAALNEVGIGEHARERAANLSGGQQQRAALARALVQRARIVLADEPIASLDPESSRRVMDMLRALNRDHGITVLVSLHQVDIAMRYCPRTIALRRGKVVYDGPSSTLTPPLLKKLYGDDAHELLDDAAHAAHAAHDAHDAHDAHAPQTAHDTPARHDAHSDAASAVSHYPFALEPAPSN
ncbi:phosphonate ABC transporter ATP-binding protein [Paraburkholderia antibiotica]|uniref:Phosphonate ABC transporter ATP-binding protein n=1 Tax=Paraburkholderia antibiotica TaxID=2728839 RepID=A0A7X9X738_9BURK|nr:phosphonate ABC transporter ATP-binding protein [Paraburkholderia antibiotica]NML32610.1 phosphonate ABC transporter ATP-binding protein [Paraburkholderia antibiotica]